MCVPHPLYSDGKSYDAYIMPFEGPRGLGLTAQDQRMLEAVLEEELGYSLCLYHRDVLPGQGETPHLSVYLGLSINQCLTVSLSIRLAGCVSDWLAGCG